MDKTSRMKDKEPLVNDKPEKLATSGKKSHPTEENEVDINLFQGLDHPMPSLEALLVPPNAKTPEEIITIANNNQSPSAVSAAIGKLVEPGKVGIISVNGQIQLVGPGRYIFPNPRASLKYIESLTKNQITYETLTICRVQRGEVGVAMDNGQPLLLGEGIHVRNNRLFQMVRFESINQQTLSHGSIHVIRVPKGHYGLITENAVPKLLPEGIHVTNSNVFQFEKFELINQPYIRHGTLHILRIPQGKVALVNDNNRPRLLEGTHCINSKTFTFIKMEDINQLVIRHGTITQFRVRKGEVGLGWDNNQPAFFDEGVFIKDSPLFAFENCVSASEKQIVLGAKKIVTVWDGEVGVSYLKGKLVVLKPDRHIIDSTEHVFQGFLSTQQQCLHLIDPKYAKDGILSCETKDFVEIGLKADVFYKIADAEKVLLVVGKDNIDPLVRETAIATLNSIIRSTSLAEVAQNKEFAAKSEKNAHPEAAPMFFDKVHDEFISKLHDSFMSQFGVSITNIRIESFKIMNQELATSISKQAFTTAQTETQLSNLAGQTEIATAQMKRDAEVARIKAEGEAIKLKTETDAKNRSIMESAKAEADAAVIRAKAEAQAIEFKAQAEARSILLKAEAEAKRAEMLAATPLGGQIQMYQMYAAMVKDSLQGVEKVIYMPTDAMNNPLSFMNLTQGVIPGFTPAENKKIQPKQ
eukprot:TRINITY_DN1125_c0_g1_i4.p1 TRINITY_DN1125_c0_g1~~TRINITY_DN1125_c0_g1_i4.p1  ORF type:complete len:733 (-),score=224.80 TRINITY_DN1125_c0_g1_i4:49-2136(-)